MERIQLKYVRAVGHTPRLILFFYRLYFGRAKLC